MANAKHFVDNSQETNRAHVNEMIDERTQFELYYPPFEGAIEASVGSAMCSYNIINSAWSCENNQTLNTDLRERLGFEGFVMSDWGATHSLSIEQGLDQEMGFDYHNRYFNEFELSKVPSNVLDNSMMRLFTQFFKIGAFDQPKEDFRNITANVTT